MHSKGDVDMQREHIKLSASADGRCLLSLGGIIGILDEVLVMVAFSHPADPSSRGFFIWRSFVDDEPLSRPTSVVAFRFFRPLAPSAFFLRGRVGLTSPGSKTSSGRLQLKSQVSLHRLQRVEASGTYFLTCCMLTAHESWSSLSYFSHAKQRFLNSLT